MSAAAVANEVTAAIMHEPTVTNHGSNLKVDKSSLVGSASNDVATVLPATLSGEADKGGQMHIKSSFTSDMVEDMDGSKSAPSSTIRKRRRRGWTEEEEKRLREGVAQHGAGQWAKIRDSYGFKSEHEGEGRTCVNLKDKWRNLNRPPRPEKPPKTEQSVRPPRKKKPRTPKRKRDSGGTTSSAGSASAIPTPTSAVDDDGDPSRPAPPPAWIPAAAAWCKANLVQVDKGKVHVGALRTKFANSAEYFPGKEVFGDDESELENLKYDLENPKTEASKKFRSDALEPFVGADAIRQNCFIGGLNQLGVFGWAVKGEMATPPARAPPKSPAHLGDDHPADDVAAQVAAEAVKIAADTTAMAGDSAPIAGQHVMPATLGADAEPMPPKDDDKDSAPPKKRLRRKMLDEADQVKTDAPEDEDAQLADDTPIDHLGPRVEEQAPNLLGRVMRNVAAVVGAGSAQQSATSQADHL